MAVLSALKKGSRLLLLSFFTTFTLQFFGALADCIEKGFGHSDMDKEQTPLVRSLQIQRNTLAKSRLVTLSMVSCFGIAKRHSGLAIKEYDKTEDDFLPNTIPFLFAYLIVTSSWMLRSSLGTWQTRNTRTKPMQTAARLSSKILRRSLQCCTCRN